MPHHARSSQLGCLGTLSTKRRCPDLGVAIFDGHRFHIRIDRRAVKKARESGVFIEHGLAKGISFNGVQVAQNAYLVARVRWSWDLQRPRFRQEAVTRTPVPEIGPNQDGAMLNTELHPNSAWDVDFVVSYDSPYWPDADESDRDNSRLGPLSNGSGMWLTATSYHCSMMKIPSPELLTHPLPRPGQKPQYLLSAGLGPEGVDDMFWFVEGITYRDTTLMLFLGRVAQSGIASASVTHRQLHAEEVLAFWTGSHPKSCRQASGAP